MRCAHLAVFCCGVALLPGCPGDVHLSRQDRWATADAWVTADAGFVSYTPDSAAPAQDLSLRGDARGADQGGCTPNQTRACYTGPAATRSTGLCKDGVETCDATGIQWIQGCVGEVLPGVEMCGDSLDNDCDGEVDEGCINKVTVQISGDCVSVTCPASAPYPVGCKITMGGSDCRGCVAHSAGSSKVYFQEGDQCGGSNVQGQLFCSNVQGKGLDASNCGFNKTVKSYVSSAGDCPDSDSGCGTLCTWSLCGSPLPVPGSDPECYCDADCSSYGDCCPGHDSVCP